MLNKIKLSTLLFIFIILLVLVSVLLLHDSKKGDRSFRSDLVEMDTAKVTSIIIIPRSDKDQPVKIKKQGSGWKVTVEAKDYNADKNSINSMLSSLTELKSLRVAATDKSKWESFEVNDSLATRVQIKAGKKKITDIYIGKFFYKQPQNPNPYSRNQMGKMTTYVRLQGDKEVYAVDGFLSMIFNRKAGDFRDKTVIMSNKSDWSRLTFTYPADSSFILYNESGRWMIDGILADSANVVNYLNKISRLSSSEFADNQQPLNASPDFKLSVEGASPIQVKAYAAADSLNAYLVSSSMNEGVFFNGIKDGLMDKLFIGKSELIAK
ncbi:MAG: DUF4340 domain-containing protein [Bacteroidales bacterium]|nr:DUF4340 domain-containing protein [Bacteroidales bacterium]